MQSPHDYSSVIHSSTNVIYTKWEQHFAWWPVTTINGSKRWLCEVYRRDRKLLHDLPQFPVKALDRIQYATFDEIIERKIKGLP